MVGPVIEEDIAALHEVVVEDDGDSVQLRDGHDGARLTLPESLHDLALGREPQSPASRGALESVEVDPERRLHDGEQPLPQVVTEGDDLCHVPSGNTAGSGHTLCRERRLMMQLPVDRLTISQQLVELG
jgi:hypothetical protein